MITMISVDPGSNGGLAFWDKDKLVRVHRLKKTTGSRFFMPNDLFPLASMRVETLVIEEPFWHKPPKQSMVHHGTTLACWGQLLGALNYATLETVTAKAWKGRTDLSSKKSASLDLAREMFPEFADQMKYAACDGVAEAILIGVDYVNRHK